MSRAYWLLAHTLILPYLIHTCDVVYYLVWRVQWYTTEGNFLLVEFVFLKINWEYQIKSRVTQLTIFDLFYNNNQNSNPPNYTRESTCLRHNIFHIYIYIVIFLGLMFIVNLNSTILRSVFVVTFFGLFWSFFLGLCILVIFGLF